MIMNWTKWLHSWVSQVYICLSWVASRELDQLINAKCHFLHYELFAHGIWSRCWSRDQRQGRQVIELSGLALRDRMESGQSATICKTWDWKWVWRGSLLRIAPSYPSNESGCVLGGYSIPSLSNRIVYVKSALFIDILSQFIYVRVFELD